MTDNAPAVEILPYLPSGEYYYHPNIEHEEWKDKIDEEEATLLSRIRIGCLTEEISKKEFGQAKKAVASDAKCRLTNNNVHHWRASMLGHVQDFSGGRATGKLLNDLRGSVLAYRFYLGKPGRGTGRTAQSTLATEKEAQEQWDKDDVALGSIIFVSLSPTVDGIFRPFLLTAGVLTGSAALEIIKSQMTTHGAGAATSLKQKIFNVKQNGRSVKTTADELIEMFTEYSQMTGHDIPESDKIQALFSALNNDDMKMFKRVTLHELNKHKYKRFVDFMRVAILDEQMVDNESDGGRREHEAFGARKYHGSKSRSDPPEASRRYKTRDRSPPRRSSKQKAEDGYRQRKQGNRQGDHSAPSGSATKKKGVCYLCGDHGHYAKDCTNRPRLNAHAIEFLNRLNPQSEDSSSDNESDRNEPVRAPRTATLKSYSGGKAAQGPATVSSDSSGDNIVGGAIAVPEQSEVNVWIAI